MKRFVLVILIVFLCSCSTLNTATLEIKSLTQVITVNHVERVAFYFDYFAQWRVYVTVKHGSTSVELRGKGSTIELALFDALKELESLRPYTEKE